MITNDFVERLFTLSNLAPKASQLLLFRTVIEKNIMTENKEYLVLLNERGLLSDIELAEKINLCFILFKDKTLKILGDKIFKTIYN